MSQSSFYSAAGTSVPTIVGNLVAFYRRWFASETIYNQRALDEIGLGFLRRR